MEKNFSQEKSMPEESKRVEHLLKFPRFFDEKYETFLRNLPNDQVDAFIEEMDVVATEIGEITSEPLSEQDIQKLKESESSFPDARAIVLALRVNDNGYRMATGVGYIKAIKEYLTSDQLEYEKELNAEKQVEIDNYYSMGGEPGGYSIIIGGKEKAISYGEEGEDVIKRIRLAVEGLLNDDKITAREAITSLRTISKDKEKKDSLKSMSVEAIKGILE